MDANAHQTMVTVKCENCGAIQVIVRGLVRPLCSSCNRELSMTLAYEGTR